MAAMANPGVPGGAGKKGRKDAGAGQGGASAPGGGAAGQGASRHQQGKSAPASGAAAASVASTEQGICIICGEACSGIPAEPDFAVRAARKLRSVLSLPARHTMVCKAHEAEALSKRAGFEKKRREYSYGAILFFAMMVFGSLFFGRGDLGLFIPALIGALIIAALPFFYYFPSFRK